MQVRFTITEDLDRMLMYFLNSFPDYNPDNEEDEHTQFVSKLISSVCFAGFGRVTDAVMNARPKRMNELTYLKDMKYYYGTDRGEVEFAEKCIDFLNENCDCATFRIVDTNKEADYYCVAKDKRSTIPDRFSTSQKIQNGKMYPVENNPFYNEADVEYLIPTAEFLYEVEYDFSKFDNKWGLFAFLYMVSMILRLGNYSEDRIQNMGHKPGYELTPEFICRLSETSGGKGHSICDSFVLSDDELLALLKVDTYNTLIKTQDSYTGAYYSSKPSQSKVSKMVRQYLERLEAENAKEESEMGMEMEAQPEQAYDMEVEMDGMPENA